MGDKQIFLESKCSGQRYSMGKRKAFRQAVIQVSLVGSAKTVFPGKAQSSGCLCQLNRYGGRDQEPAVSL